MLAAAGGAESRGGRVGSAMGSHPYEGFGQGSPRSLVVPSLNWEVAFGGMRQSCDGWEGHCWEVTSLGFGPPLRASGCAARVEARRKALLGGDITGE